MHCSFVFKGNSSRGTLTELLSFVVLQAMKPDLPHAGRAGLKEYITYGYCPSDVVGSSVSLTLAYAYDDWYIASNVSRDVNPSNLITGL